MELLKSVWEGEKYVSKESISRWWRKADILPVTWNSDINNNVVSESIPQMDKVTRDDIPSEMCELTSSVKFITEEYCVDTVDDAVFLKG